jgi:hypothetical protein
VKNPSFKKTTGFNVDGRKRYCRKLWGGFLDGRLDVEFYRPQDGPGTTPAIFTSRRRAKEVYEDVRRIEVREL